MSITSYNDLRKILLVKPHTLFTRDIAQAWQHYRAGFDVQDISAFNNLKNNDGRKTSNEFIVPWSDCWDIDDAELVDKKVD